MNMGLGQGWFAADIRDDYKNSISLKKVNYWWFLSGTPGSLSYHPISDEFLAMRNFFHQVYLFLQYPNTYWATMLSGHFTVNVRENQTKYAHTQEAWSEFSTLMGRVCFALTGTIPATHWLGLGNYDSSYDQLWIISSPYNLIPKMGTHC